MHQVKLVTVFMALLLTTAVQAADMIGSLDANGKLNNYLSFLEQLSNPSPLETAGSHGSLGYTLGTGVSLIEKKPSDILDTELQSSSDKPQTNVPKIWVTKGIFWPLDGGLSYSTILNTNVSSYTAYLQWTAFEKFALPALALRTAYTNITGLKNTKFNNMSLGAAISWGYRFVTVFASENYNFYSTTITPPEEEAYALSTDSLSMVNKSWGALTQSIGMQLNLVSPFFKISGEKTIASNQSSSYRFKLSFGM